MRSYLDPKGRMRDPTDLFEALDRRAQLSHEMRKIEAQLREAARQQNPVHGGYESYADWKQAAEARLRLFREEQRQLQAWIEPRRETEALLKQAWELLRRLEDETDFEPTESAFVRRLDKFFGAKERKTVLRAVPPERH